MIERRILLVEDEPGLVFTLTDLLLSEGYTVTHAGDYASALAAIRSGGFDAIILDLMLPGGSGLDALREMRSRGDGVPVLVLTARSSVPERVVGLKAGADDYLGKPFDSEELLARVEALVRRTKAGAGGVGGERRVIRFGDVEIDRDRAEARKAGEPMQLTVQEFRLLVFLAEHPGKTMPRNRLLEEAWGYAGAAASRTVDMHVSSLRQKIGDDPAKPRWIVTVRGFGYRFEAEA
ncbi:MAG: response regulator transcription factor [Spirochaetes bacterium]|nr:response regulator transcription factor [Spirochaetota bacterium]MBU1081473.1 response regulator transcription factor [Spirochaetota bacterium]